MNKAITDGVDLMPPGFGEGLNVWSNQDGTPGSTTYNSAGSAAIVPSDSDFGTCLELQKTDAVQKLRYTGETPLLAGCYLKVTARLKAMSGNLPSVRVAGWAGAAGGAHVAGLVETGPEVALTTYGDIVEVTAIIGAGNRGGVDMVWGPTPVYGHFGLDLTGGNGGVVRIEDIRIEDATHVFLRDMMDWVDVRDFGAIGDGVADDRAAFEAADVAAAGGRKVLVSEGTYFIGNHLTIDARVRFEGKVVMADETRLILMQNYELTTYVDAFGDEELALKKALQALFNFTDHESLDMGGRRIKLTAPLDVHAAAVDKDNFANRRVLRNGQLESDGGAAWDTEVRVEQAAYNPAFPTRLSNVTGLAEIPVGSLVEGIGVGREIYVRSKNVAAGTIELSLPLYAAPALQTYTFRRFKYLLDFSGFTFLQRFAVDDVEFLCQGNCSGLLLPDDGLTFQIRDCYITAPKDRGVTSAGGGCSGLELDRNHFLSNEQAMDAGDRTTIAFNVNSNDAKIRDNLGVRFKHFGVMHGAGHLILSNHFYQGDNAHTADRTAGLVLTAYNCGSVLANNYVDNCSIDWTNERDESPDNETGATFGGLTVEGNFFFANHAPNWFAWLRVKPCGANHYINGLNVSGNIFRHSTGTVARVDVADESIAPLKRDSFRDILFQGNTFYAVDQKTMNPLVHEIDQPGFAQAWSADVGDVLPFAGKAQRVVSVVAHNQIDNPAGTKIFALPYAVTKLGTNGTEIKLHWPEAVSGKVYATIRTDLF
ncbi:MAG: right-handed parallel beta-helix repeat-containing protein [Rhodobacteraceae bacterium]|nr:right-handed parallel beta-helix repeat-containing protein [Paracoccaceae bacterium]